MSRSLEVLLIEDDPTSRLMVERKLKQIPLPIKVTWRKSMAQGLAELSRGNKFDLLCLDLGLPDVDNSSDRLAALNLIQSCYPDLKVTIITSEHDPEVRRRAKDLGAEFLEKDEALVISADDLQDKIANLVPKFPISEKAFLNMVAQLQTMQTKVDKLEGHVDEFDKRLFRSNGQSLVSVINKSSELITELKAGLIELENQLQSRSEQLQVRFEQRHQQLADKLDERQTVAIAKRWEFWIALLGLLGALAVAGVTFQNNLASQAKETNEREEILRQAAQNQKLIMEAIDKIEKKDSGTKP